MRKRKKPYLLIAVVAVLLCVVGYMNLKTLFGSSEAPQAGPHADEPATHAEKPVDQKEAMKAALRQSSGQRSIPLVDKGQGPTTQPMVMNPEVKPQKPVPTDAQTGRLSDEGRN